MKRVGCFVRCNQQRNNDLMRAYSELIGSVGRISLPEIYRQVVNMPTSRFWVGEERASAVIGSMMKGDKLDDMNPQRREMYEEIYRRAMILRRRNPKLSILEIVTIVVNQPAPKFYLTPGTARVYIINAKKEWYEQRRKKLKHLFY